MIIQEFLLLRLWMIMGALGPFRADLWQPGGAEHVDTRSHFKITLPSPLVSSVSWFLVLNVQVAVNMETEPPAMIGRRLAISQVEACVLN